MRLTYAEVHKNQRKQPLNNLVSRLCVTFILWWDLFLLSLALVWCNARFAHSHEASQKSVQAITISTH